MREVVVDLMQVGGCLDVADAVSAVLLINGSSAVRESIVTALPLECGPV
jgi:hypothetical protein